MTFVFVEGVCRSVRAYPGLSKSKNPQRNMLYLLSPVYVNGALYDHMHIPGYKALCGLAPGMHITLVGRFRYYTRKNGTVSWSIAAPYKNVKVSSGQ